MGTLDFGGFSLTFAQSEALYAVAIAGEIRRRRREAGDQFPDLPRVRMSKRSQYAHAHDMSVNAATARTLAQLGLIISPMRRVYGESSDFAECPELTDVGRAALNSRWKAILAISNRLLKAERAIVEDQKDARQSKPSAEGPARGGPLRKEGR